jgi:hypothetical protein
LCVYFGDGFAQGFEFLHHLRQVGAVWEGTVCAQDTGEHGSELGGELGDFCQRFFEDGGELEKAEGVACGGGVEDYGFVGHGFYLFEDFGEGHRFVDSGDLGFLLAY